MQIDLTDDEDRLVEIFKAENRIDTKENAVKEMIKKSGNCKHKFDLVEKSNVPAQYGKIKIIQRCIYCGELKKDIM
ncbi:DUF2683 family protein [Candidatus Woesearchaeota archaeon]|nr:DUF2683 family protein [Candidatus Woesearchaeota archaeon]